MVSSHSDPGSTRDSDNDEVPIRVARQRWEDAIPWFLTGASAVSLGVIAWFLIENVMWFRDSAIHDGDLALATYRLHVYHLHIAMIKRSVGLFSGFALLFLGTAVVFYSLRTSSDLSFKGAGLETRVLSTSPGLIAMALGVVLILGTMWSKDSFAGYAGESLQPERADSMVVVPFQPTR